MIDREAAPVARQRLGRRPAEALLLGGLLGLSALAWLVTQGLATSKTRLGLLTGAAGEQLAHHHGAESGGLQVVGGGLFMAMWVAMVAAMMLPTVLPVVSTFDGWVRRTGRPRSLTLVFVGGYVSTWSACGLAAYALLIMLQAWLPADHDAVIRVGAVLLAGAGLYQFSTVKGSCLSRCRSPLAMIAEHAVELQRGYRGPWRVGAGHGLYCVGCCWSLMIVLVLLGMMSLVWMGLLAAVMLAEKAAPWGVSLSRAVGGALVVVGAGLLVWPTTLPALV